MKKLLFLLALIMLVQPVCEARDYAKMHMNQTKRNKQYRIDKTYFADYSPAEKDINLEIKDPKLIKLGGYQEISSEKMKAKLEKDNIEYSKVLKFLTGRKVNEYHMQAYAQDFYRAYRITEKIIRANGLDFINWRLTVDSDNIFNAYNMETNSITVNAGALDTLRDNDSALALVIGHEIAHGILGHSKRKVKYIAKIKRAQRRLNYTAYQLAIKKYNKACRDMEYEADIEGAKLAARAGYNMASAKETILYMNTINGGDEWNQTHPDPDKRLKNYEQNRKYFMEDEWKKQGLYNIYNTKVLTCDKSSNRSSVVLTRNNSKNQDIMYISETMQDLYLRYGYNSYKNGEFKDAVRYLKKYLKYDKSNYAVYLYISYAYEYLHKQSNSESHLNSAKEFIGYANQLAPNNKYVKEQLLAL